MVQRKRKLTDRIPQPVGMKANIEANMSGKDSSVNITATTKPASATKREIPCIKRKRSWKLTDIFWLKVNTYCSRIKDSIKIQNYQHTHLNGAQTQHIFFTLKRIISTARTTHERP